MTNFLYIKTNSFLTDCTSNRTIPHKYMLYKYIWKYRNIFPLLNILNFRNWNNIFSKHGLGTETYNLCVAIRISPNTPNTFINVVPIFMFIIHWNERNLFCFEMKNNYFVGNWFFRSWRPRTVSWFASQWQIWYSS